MEAIRVRAFGSLRLIFDRKAHPITTPTSALLLGYLICHAAGGQPITRSRLAGTLWPDVTEARARRHLTDTLYRLRRAIGAEIADRLLRSDEDTLTLGEVIIDMNEFRRLAASVRAEDWEVALNLYTGELLEDLDADWLLAPREHLHEIYLATLERTCAALVESGAVPEALAIALRWAEADNRAAGSSAGITIASGKSIEIVHATFAGDGLNSKQAIYAASSAVLITNMIITSHTIGIERGNLAIVTAQRNLFFGNTINITGGVTNTSPIGGDPRFIDPVNANYHLTLESAALDTGINLNLSTDFEDDLRFIGAGVDVGADEFGDATVVSSTQTTQIGVQPRPGQQISITIELRYTDADVTGMNEAALEVLVWDEIGQAWIEAQETCALPTSPVRQTGSNRLIVSTCAEGEFALAGGSYQLYLPIVRRS